MSTSSTTASSHSTTTSKRAPLRKIGLAFGDSLTEGYTFNRGRLVFTPYTDKLSELLDMDVVNAGVSGERTDSMVPRLAQNLVQFEKDSLDLVLLLGGTNDLAGYGDDIPQRIAKNVENMANQAIEHGTKTLVVMTLPPCRIRDEDENEQLQKQLSITNDLIRTLVSKLKTSVEQRAAPRLFLVDLASSFTDADMIDGVHFCQAKYDAMAVLIHKTITTTD